MIKKLRKKSQPFSLLSICFVVVSISALMFLEVVIVISDLNIDNSTRGYITIIVLLGIVGLVAGLRLVHKLLDIDAVSREN